MVHGPALRGLPPRIFLPIVAAILLLAAIPIISFLRTGLRTGGSAIGTSTLAPPPQMLAVVSALRNRIAKNPHDVEALEALAGLETSVGKFAAAAALDAQAVAAQPRDAALRAAYAETLNDLGRTTEAKQQLDEAFAFAANNPSLLYERGVIEDRLGQHAAAEQDFAHFLNVAPAADPRRAELTGRSGQR